jgi:hypothetical protein
VASVSIVFRSRYVSVDGETLESDVKIAALTMLVFAISDKFIRLMTVTPSGCGTRSTVFESLTQLALL